MRLLLTLLFFLLAFNAEADLMCWAEPGSKICEW